MSEKKPTYSIVEMCHKTKRCRIIPYGNVQTHYRESDILVLHDEQDWEYQWRYTEPYCVLKWSDWLDGVDIDE